MIIVTEMNTQIIRTNQYCHCEKLWNEVLQIIGDKYWVEMWHDLYQTTNGTDSFQIAVYIAKCFIECFVQYIPTVMQRSLLCFVYCG